MVVHVLLMMHWDSSSIFAVVALLSSYLARLRHLASKEDVNTSLRVSRILGHSPKGMWPLSTGPIISTKSILQGNFVSRHSPLGDPKV